MMIKYVVCPGTVTSKTDGQQHYINAHQLMKLYRVRPEECVIHVPQGWWRLVDFDRAARRHEGLIRLEPRYDGNYTLPQESADRNRRIEMNTHAEDIENRYRAVYDGFWWVVAIGDGQQVVGNCYTKTEAQRLAAALLTAFRDGVFFAEKELDHSCHENCTVPGCVNRRLREQLAEYEKYFKEFGSTYRGEMK